MNLEAINSSLDKMTTHYTKAQGQKELLEASLSLAQGKLETVQNSIIRGELVQVLLTKTSDFARVQLKARVEATVTAGIQAIFQNDDEFFVDMGEFRGQAAADWKVRTKGGVVDPENGDGGGLSDTVSTTLRLSILETSRPKIGGAVFLDEPAKMISGKSSGSDFINNMAVFLREYARLTNRQFFMVTHNPSLMNVADVSYRVTQGKDGISNAQKATYQDMLEELMASEEKWEGAEQRD